MSLKSVGEVGTLPARLRNFFARYPPQHYSSLVAPRSAVPEGESTTEEALPSPYTPDRDAKGAHKPDPEKFSLSRSLLVTNKTYRNPFLPYKPNATAPWRSPRYGLRQQADLVKLAVKYNVEALLPIGRKSTEFKAARMAERGLAIKGTGIGQKVKGHKWERTMEARLEDRRKAMVEMPEMIRLWKQVSYLWVVTITLTWKLTHFSREVMVVAGASGPSGKRHTWIRRIVDYLLFNRMSNHSYPLILMSTRSLVLSGLVGKNICMNIARV